MKAVMLLLKIGICEDDVHHCKYLYDLLREYSYTYGLNYRLDTFNSGKDLLAKDEIYDILFLDIDMPEIDGIELGECIRRKNKIVKIIYVTAYADYALRAFRVHAFEYLIKPVEKELFFAKIKEVLQYIQFGDSVERLYFKKEKGFVIFKPEDILYFESVPSHRICIVTTKDMVDIRGTIEQTLKQVEHAGFVRCHKSYIVNLFYIVRIEGYRICLQDGRELPLAARGAREFKESFNDYLQKKIESDLGV